MAFPTPLDVANLPPAGPGPAATLGVEGSSPWGSGGTTSDVTPEGSSLPATAYKPKLGGWRHASRKIATAHRTGRVLGALARGVVPFKVPPEGLAMLERSPEQRPWAAVQHVAKLLQKIPLFVDVPIEGLLQLATTARCKHFQPMTVACLQGEPTTGMFILLEGSASCYVDYRRPHGLVKANAKKATNNKSAAQDDIAWAVNEPDKDKVDEGLERRFGGKVFDTKPGHVFGEISEKKGNVHQCTVVVRRKARVIVVSVGEFALHLKPHVSVTPIQGRVRQILRTPPAQRAETDVNDLRYSGLVPKPAFSCFPPRVFEQCHRYITLQTLPPGAIVYKQDEVGDRFYIVLKGKVGMYARDWQHGDKEQVQRMRRGSGGILRSASGNLKSMSGRNIHAGWKTVKAVGKLQVLSGHDSPASDASGQEAVPFPAPVSRPGGSGKNKERGSEGHESEGGDPLPVDPLGEPPRPRPSADGAGEGASKRPQPSAELRLHRRMSRDGEGTAGKTLLRQELVGADMAKYGGAGSESPKPDGRHLLLRGPPGGGGQPPLLDLDRTVSMDHKFLLESFAAEGPQAEPGAADGRSVEANAPRRRLSGGMQRRLSTRSTQDLLRGRPSRVSDIPEELEFVRRDSVTSAAAMGAGDLKELVAGILGLQDVSPSGPAEVAIPSPSAEMSPAEEEDDISSGTSFASTPALSRDNSGVLSIPSDIGLRVPSSDAGLLSGAPSPPLLPLPAPGAAGAAEAAEAAAVEATAAAVAAEVEAAPRRIERRGSVSHKLKKKAVESYASKEEEAARDWDRARLRLEPQPAWIAMSSPMDARTDTEAFPPYVDNHAALGELIRDIGPADGAVEGPAGRGYFGERALATMDGRLRTHSIMCLEPTEVLVVGRGAYEEMLGMARMRDKSNLGRYNPTVDVQALYLECLDALREKPSRRNSRQLAVMVDVLSKHCARSSFFFGVGIEISLALVHSASLLRLEGPGQLVCQQGDPGDTFHFIIDGCVEVHVATEGSNLARRLDPTLEGPAAAHAVGRGQVGAPPDLVSRLHHNPHQPHMFDTLYGPSVDVLHQGESFGEVSLCQRKRTATIITRETTELLTVSRSNFDQVLKMSHATELGGMVEMMDRIELLQRVFRTTSFQRLVELSRHMTRVEVNRRVAIIDEGDRGRQMYFLHTGSCSVLASSRPPPNLKGMVPVWKRADKKGKGKDKDKGKDLGSWETVGFSAGGSKEPTMGGTKEPMMGGGKEPHRAGRPLIQNRHHPLRGSKDKAAPPPHIHNVIGRWDTKAALQSGLPAEDLPPRVAVIGPGELFGDLGVVFDAPQPNTVLSENAGTVLYAINDGDKFLQLLSGLQLEELRQCVLRKAGERARREREGYGGAEAAAARLMRPPQAMPGIPEEGLPPPSAAGTPEEPARPASVALEVAAVGGYAALLAEAGAAVSAESSPAARGPGVVASGPGGSGPPRGASGRRMGIMGEASKDSAVGIRWSARKPDKREVAGRGQQPPTAPPESWEVAGVSSMSPARAQDGVNGGCGGGGGGGGGEGGRASPTSSAAPQGGRAAGYIETPTLSGGGSSKLRFWSSREDGRRSSGAGCYRSPYPEKVRWGTEDGVGQIPLGSAGGVGGGEEGEHVKHVRWSSRPESRARPHDLSAGGGYETPPVRLAAASSGFPFPVYSASPSPGGARASPAPGAAAEDGGGDEAYDHDEVAGGLRHDMHSALKKSGAANRSRSGRRGTSARRAASARLMAQASPLPAPRAPAPPRAAGPAPAEIFGELGGVALWGSKGAAGDGHLPVATLSKLEAGLIARERYSDMPEVWQPGMWVPEGSWAEGAEGEEGAEGAEAWVAERAEGGVAGGDRYDAEVAEIWYSVAPPPQQPTIASFYDLLEDKKKPKVYMSLSGAVQGGDMRGWRLKAADLLEPLGEDARKAADEALSPGVRRGGRGGRSHSVDLGAVEGPGARMLLPALERSASVDPGEMGEHAHARRARERRTGGLTGSRLEPLPAPGPGGAARGGRPRAAAGGEEVEAAVLRLHDDEAGGRGPFITSSKRNSRSTHASSPVWLKRKEATPKANPRMMRSQISPMRRASMQNLLAAAAADHGDPAAEEQPSRPPPSEALSVGRYPAAEPAPVVERAGWAAAGVDGLVNLGGRALDFDVTGWEGTSPPRAAEEGVVLLASLSDARSEGGGGEEGGGEEGGGEEGGESPARPSRSMVVLIPDASSVSQGSPAAMAEAIHVSPLRRMASGSFNRKASARAAAAKAARASSPSPLSPGLQGGMPKNVAEGEVVASSRLAIRARDEEVGGQARTWSGQERAVAVAMPPLVI